MSAVQEWAPSSAAYALDVARVLVMQVEVDQLDGVPADDRLALPGAILSGTADDADTELWNRLSVEAQLMLHGAVALVTVGAVAEGLVSAPGWRSLLAESTLRVAGEVLS